MSPDENVPHLVSRRGGEVLKVRTVRLCPLLSTLLSLARRGVQQPPAPREASRQAAAVTVAGGDPGTLLQPLVIMQHCRPLQTAAECQVPSVMRPGLSAAHWPPQYCSVQCAVTSDALKLGK